MQNFFNLQEGEKVLQEIKPEGGLRWYFLLSPAGSVSSISVFFALMFVLVRFWGFSFFWGNSYIWLFIVVFAFAALAIGLVFALLRYSKQHYWITNKRVVYKRGLIGYRITSIPYERISDVIISRTLLEKIFGFGSLHVQSLAGQVSGAHTLGSEGVLLAIPDPETTQELIFKLVKIKRKEEHLSF